MGDFFKNISDGIKDTIAKASFTLEQNAPTILLVTGIVGIGAAIFTACKATLAVPDEIKAFNEEKKELEEREKAILETIDEDEDDTDNAELAAVKQDMKSLYIRNEVQLARLYIPTILIAIFSICCIVNGHKILVNNNIALAAAYAALNKEFEEYRKEAKDRVGEDIERRIRFGIKDIKDEEGNKIGEVEPDGTAITGGRRFLFDRTTSKRWRNSKEDNLYFISIVCHDANQLLEKRGVLFLNEVLDMLGIERTVSGQDYGWIYDKNIENKIDFGVYIRQIFDDATYTNAPIWLDMNIDGDVRHALKAA